MAPGEGQPIGLMCSCGQDFIRPASGTILGLSGTWKFGRNERIYEHFVVIVFFWKDPPQTEGRRHAHPQIKT